MAKINITIKPAGLLLYIIVFLIASYVVYWLINMNPTNKIKYLNVVLIIILFGLISLIIYFLIISFQIMTGNQNPINFGWNVSYKPQYIQ
jgi:hypothetical protein